MKLTLLTDRVIVATNPNSRTAFANTLPDDDEGILINDGYCRIPVYNPNNGNVEFSMFSLRINAFDLSVGTPVTCLAERGSKGRWHAMAWAPTAYFTDAKKEFEVHQQVGDNPSSRLWQGYGILDLSRHYASERWENDGTIWRSPDGETVLWVDEVVTEHGNDYLDTPESDPRVPASQLPIHFTRSFLPHPREEYSN